MKYPVLAALIALALAPAVQAQTKGADEAKFKAADKNGNGALEGAETNAYKANMMRIDKNKDGKVTREEFLAASKSGVIR